MSVATLTLQELIDMLAINCQALANAERAGRGMEAARKLVDSNRRMIRAAATRSLTPGEIRTYQVGEVTARVLYVGSGHTQLQVRRNGELLSAFSRTDVHEHDALRHFAGLLATLTR